MSPDKRGAHAAGSARGTVGLHNSPAIKHICQSIQTRQSHTFHIRTLYWYYCTLFEDQVQPCSEDPQSLRPWARAGYNGTDCTCIERYLIVLVNTYDTGTCNTVNDDVHSCISFAHRGPRRVARDRVAYYSARVSIVQLRTALMGRPTARCERIRVS